MENRLARCRGGCGLWVDRSMLSRDRLCPKCRLTNQIRSDIDIGKSLDNISQRWNFDRKL